MKRESKSVYLNDHIVGNPETFYCNLHVGRKGFRKIPLVIELTFLLFSK